MLDKLTFPVRQPNVSRHNGAPIEDPLKPLNTIVLWCTKGMNEVLNNSPMMPRDASLSDRYTSDRWCFSSLSRDTLVVIGQFIGVRIR